VGGHPGILENAQKSRAGVILAALACLALPARGRAAQDAFFDLLTRAQNDSAPADAAADFGRAVQAWTPAEGDTLLAACYFGRAQADYSLGDLADSASDASRSMELDPGNWRALLVRGKAQLALGLYRKAALDLERTALFHPEDGDAYLYLGQAQLQMERPLEASKSLRKAATLNPSDFRPLLALASLWRNRGRCDEAVPLYQKAVALSDSTLVQAQAGLGFCEYHGKHFQKALDYDDRAVESGDVALGNLIRGKAPLFIKNETQRDLAQAYFWRGLDYARLERPDSARKDYAKSCYLGYEPACRPERNCFLPDGTGRAYRVQCELGPIAAKKKPKTHRAKKNKVIYSGFKNSPGNRIYAP